MKDVDCTFFEGLTEWRKANYHTFSRRSPYNRNLMDSNSAAEVSAEWDAERECEDTTIPPAQRDRVLALLSDSPHTFYELCAYGQMSPTQLTSTLKELFRDGSIHKTGIKKYMLTSHLERGATPTSDEEIMRELNLGDATQTFADVEPVEYLRDGQRISGYYSRELDEHTSTPEALEWLKGFIS